MNKAGGYLQIMFFLVKICSALNHLCKLRLFVIYLKLTAILIFFFFFYWYIFINDRPVSKPHKYLGLRARIHLQVLQPV